MDLLIQLKGDREAADAHRDPLLNSSCFCRAVPVFSAYKQQEIRLQWGTGLPIIQQKAKC